jgi:hypothetical protein
LILQASREWWEPGGVNRLKFPFELQAEGYISRPCRESAVTGIDVCKYVIELGFNQFEWHRVEYNSSSHRRRRVFLL